MPPKKKRETTNAEPMTHTHVRLPRRGTTAQPEEVTEEMALPASAPATTPTSGRKK